MPMHRIAARLYNKPQLLVPVALLAASDYLLSRVDQRVVAAPAAPSTSRFAGERIEGDGRFRPYRVLNGTAIITIVGELVNRSFGLADTDCGFVSYEFIQMQLAAAADDPQVHSILLDVDSPGGESAGCFALGDYIRAVAAKKPIVAYVNSHAFSGGYEIASSATKIIGPRDSEVGSIGTWMLLMDFSEHLKNHGIKPRLLFKGARKVDGNPFEAPSDEALAAFDADLERIYGMFVESVATGRHITAAAVRATEAGTFFMDDAVKIGLADQVGTFDDAIVLARSLTSERTIVGAPSQAAAAKKNQLPPASRPAAKKVTEGQMEPCNCEHDRGAHPNDGPCNQCDCQKYEAKPAANEGGAAAATRMPGAGSRALADADDSDAEVARLRREVASLREDNQAQVRQRISAEAKDFVAPLLAKGDLRFNAQQVAAMSELFIVAEGAAAGLPNVVLTRGEGKDETVSLDAKSLGTFVSRQVKALAKVGAKFDVPDGELAAPKKPGVVANVTLADFDRAGYDEAAAGRIAAAVRDRRQTNKDFTRHDLYRELAGGK